MHRRALGLIVAAAGLLNGCGGYYILTVPDRVAPAGGEAPVIARLQRNDFFVLALAEPGVPLRFALASGSPERAAYTDETGYAGTVLPAPAKPGRRELVVRLCDRTGETLRGAARLYVWPKDDRIVAVDLDALPACGQQLKPAADALTALARDTRLAYMTRRSAREHAALHDWLAERGYPDGPVLLWQRKRWQIVPGPWNLPRLVIESRLVSQLAALREDFPNLQAGVCTSPLAARAFAEAGLRVIVVGAGAVDVEPVERRASWRAIAEAGL